MKYITPPRVLADVINLKLIFLLFVIIGLSFNVSGQEVTLSGPTTVSQNFNYNYYVDDYMPGPIYGFYWGAYAGQVLSSGLTYATVKWTTAGNQTLYFDADTYYDYYYGTLSVAVIGAQPATPSNPYVYAPAGTCGQATLRRSSTPPSGVTWYWQGKTYNGTSTSKGSGSSFIANEGSGYYYIRARNSSGQWSSGSGRVYVTIKAIPNSYSVTGGGSYCSGGSGVNIGLNDTQTGVTYQLKRGSINVGSAVSGTGGSISFGNHTTAGLYMVVATKTSTGCTRTMSGSAAVTVRPELTAGSISNSQTICYNNNPAPFTSTALADGGQGNHSYLWQYSMNGGTTWTNIYGTNSSIYDPPSLTTTTKYRRVVLDGCGPKFTNEVTVTVLPQLSAGSINNAQTVCYNGDPATLGSSSSASNGQGGYTYQWQHRNPGGGWSNISGATSTTYDPGVLTTTKEYRRRVISCSQTKYTNIIRVTVNPLPTSYTVTGGGSFCSGGSGVNVSLSDTQSGVNYQLKRGTTNVGSAKSGTGNGISFENQTTAGTYTVLATNASTGCTKTMSGSAVVTVYSLPTAYSATGGGSYCSGGSGVNVSLSDTQSGVNYQLKRGSTNEGSAVTGTGNGISFGNQTTVGTYTVIATNAGTGCTRTMSGSAIVTVNSLPSTYSVSGGPYCSEDIYIRAAYVSSSQLGVNYQLKLGSTNVGSPVSGTGNLIGLDILPLIAGTYNVVATMANTGCTTTMNGSVVVNSLPTKYNVIGGGSYCSNEGGVDVSLSDTDLGVSYQLYKATSGNPYVGAAVAGTGDGISFGNKPEGYYKVKATNTSTGCINIMNGLAVISTYPLPTPYGVSGGGNYCSDGGGPNITMSNSQSGVNYQLKRDGTNVGSAIAGTTSGISFGVQTTSGTYRVEATNVSTGCVYTFGSAVVTIEQTPIIYTVSGGGAYCPGGAGVDINLSNRDKGFSYQLRRNGVNEGIPWSSGSGPLTVRVTTGGTYTFVATNNANTSCTNSMSGSAVITVNSLPTRYTVTGGGYVCPGGSGVNVSLNGSQIGVNYQLQLYRPGHITINVGSPVSGTGSGISFGDQTADGDYIVTATNTSTGCTNLMNDHADVIINSCGARISKMETADFEEQITANQIEFYPNPVSDFLNLDMDFIEEGDVSIAIIDLTGKEVYACTESVVSGRNHLDLNVKLFRAGQYFLKIVHTDQTQWLKRIIIQRDL